MNEVRVPSSRPQSLEQLLMSAKQERKRAVSMTSLYLRHASLVLVRKMVHQLQGCNNEIFVVEIIFLFTYAGFEVRSRVMAALGSML